MLWRLACMSGSFYLLSSFFLPHISTIETHPWTFHHVTNISSFALRFHNCHRHTLLSVRNQRRCDSFSSKLSSNHRRASMHDFNTFNKKKKKKRFHDNLNILPPLINYIPHFFWNAWNCDHELRTHSLGLVLVQNATRDVGDSRDWMCDIRVN